jgi:hypothetical protein
MPNPQRPQTSRQAKAAYNKRCGRGYMTKAERERLEREEKREQRRFEALRKEASRREAAKRRAEKEERRREERKRLGIPEPGTRVSPGQMKIGDFLKGNAIKLEESHVGPEEGQLDTEEAYGVPMEPSQPKGEDSRLEELRFSTTISIKPNPTDPEHNQDTVSVIAAEPSQNAADIIANVDTTLLKETSARLSSPILPLVDLRSSFFASNSQIDREVNDAERTDVIEDEPKAAGILSTKPSSTSIQENNGTPRQVKAFGADFQLPALRSPALLEIQALLNGIPSSELDCI